MVQRRPCASQPRKGLACAALATIVVTLLARPAGAEEALRFAWNAPAACPDRASVLHRIDALVGATEVPADLWFDADVAPFESGRWRIVLRSGWTGSAIER